MKWSTSARVDIYLLERQTGACSYPPLLCFRRTTHLWVAEEEFPSREGTPAGGRKFGVPEGDSPFDAYETFWSIEVMYRYI